MRTVSSLASQLSAVTGRPVVVKDVPAMTIVGERGTRPIDPEASARAALRRAVKEFNNG